MMLADASRSDEIVLYMTVLDGSRAHPHKRISLFGEPPAREVHIYGRLGAFSGAFF